MSLTDFNPLVSSIIKHVNDKINVVVFGDEVKSLLKDVAENSVYKGKYTFWYAAVTERLGSIVARNIGVEAEKFNIALFDGEFKQKFFIKAKAKSDILEFLKQHTAGTLKPFLKSEERPKGDADSSHPGITVVVGSSFEELVINSDKDVFLDVWAPWCGPCVAVSPSIEKLGEVLKDNDDIIIAKLNCDKNDVDTKYFKVQSIPLFLFFPKGKKTTPLKYTGGRTTSAILKYLKEQSSVSIPVDKLLLEILKWEGLKTQRALVSKEVNTVLENIKKYSADLTEENQKIKELAGKLTEKTAKANTVDEISKLLAEFKEKAVGFYEQVKKLKHQAEKKALKNVKKMHDHEEYTKLLKDSGDKLVVVDFTATWCGPCRFIAPKFAAWSEIYTDVVFVKVDVDQIPTIPKSAVPRVSCYPTFHFMKTGKFLKKFEGADAGGIEKLIKELK